MAIARKSCRILLLLASALAASASCAQSPEVQLAFQQGATALREGRPADAERSFRNAVRLDPTLPEAHLDLGLVLGRTGKSEEGIDELRKALELNPRLDSAHLFLGVFLYQTGRIEDAIPQLQQELAANPNSGEALTWLGIVQLAAGRPELATGPLDAAATFSPDDLNLLEYRGRAHSQVAQASYSHMATLSPDAWQVHKIRAELYVAESKDADAIAEYQAALARETRNPDLYEGLGDAYRRMNDLEGAHKAYQHELELSSQNPIAMYNLGSTDIDQGDHAAGIPLLEAMLRINSTSLPAQYYLGRGLAESNRDAEAVTWLERTAKADPNGEVGKRSYYELSRIYRKLKRPEDAERALTAYNQRRLQDEKQKADRLADWRKVDQNPAARSLPVATNP